MNLRPPAPMRLVLVALLASLAGATPNAKELYRLAPPSDNPEAPPSCGYGSCPATDPSRLNVHLVAHTHDDVGWLKTVDQYYYGTRKRDSPMGVQFILDSIVPALIMDRSKRFIYVEMSFFSKWWAEQNDAMKEAVRRLVDEGRLEFINGGWCMNDEATVTYQSTIEQMTIGLRFLQEQFGACGHPRVGWQIDPFGHTNEQASLFAQFGFDGMFFTRISANDKNQRTQNKSLDIIWHGDRALSGQSGSIFTNIFRDGYDSPTGYCFDAFCYDDYPVDNKDSYEYNIDEKARHLIKFARKYAEAKLTNHVLIPIGGDFHFTAANQNFKALDKLMQYVRAEMDDVNIFYSTPSCYQFAVHQATKQRSIKLPEKYDDFMPYESSDTVWWSGYFSSRPSVKLVEREVANVLPVARLVSFANLIRRPSSNWPAEVRDHESKCLDPLWEILGDLQHHDAVTGTEKQHVADDYVRRSSDAMAKCSKFMGELRRAKLNDFMNKSPKLEQLREAGRQFKLDSVYISDTQFCPLLNISQCDAIESEVSAVELLDRSLASNRNLGHQLRRRSSAPSASKVPRELATKSVLLNVYNPLARPVNSFDIRIPCISRCNLDKIKVIHLATNETMKLVRLPNPSGVSTLPFRDSLTNYEILFYANVPALGYTSFLVEDLNAEEIVDEEEDSNDSVVITDDSVHKSKGVLRSRRPRRAAQPEYEYMEVNMGHASSGAGSVKTKARARRDVGGNHQDPGDKVIVKFEMSTGTIVGLKRVKDGSVLNITQKFGYYFPANSQAPPGAYIFRPNTSEPIMLQKPLYYKMYKRRNGGLIEIHQKWADWIWQTIRVDAKKNYIEFDYVVGPIPTAQGVGREVISRYTTSMSNRGVFLTDSNARQLLTRHRLRSARPEHTGGSFFPVVSTIMLRDIAATGEPAGNNTVDAVAVLVDRAQAGTSLHDGQIELLVHRRMLRDDNWGVAEALNEPGEDGRGLVTRGKHRLYLRFREDSEQTSADSEAANRTGLSRPRMFELAATPRVNLHYEKQFAINNNNRTKNHAMTTKTYLVHDRVYNELRQESVKLAMRPVLTFDRLRVGANDFMDMISSDGVKLRTDLTILNTTLPDNVHLLTLQPWRRNNSILIRLENLDNPLTLHPFPDTESFRSMYNYYFGASDFHEAGTAEDNCVDQMRPRVEVNIEHLIKRIRIVSVEELNLGADVRLRDEKRLNWTDELSGPSDCDSGLSQTSIRLAPRQIRTFLATFEPL